MDNKYHDYLLSSEWQLKRASVLAFWGGRCALCYSDQFIEVHHRTYVRLYHELLTDLIPLCNNCHGRHSEFMRHGQQTIQEVTQIIMAEMLAR